MYYVHIIHNMYVISYVCRYNKSREFGYLDGLLESVR